MTRLSAEGEPIETWGDGEMPDGFVWHNASHRVAEISNQWRVHTRWWEPREMVWRHYLKVITDDGMLCQIYRDVRSGRWFLARVYD